MITCNQCQSEISSGKFCSKSCSATFSNTRRAPRNAESKAKTSASLTGTVSPLRKYKICPFCTTTFFKGSSKYCSNKCYNDDPLTRVSRSSAGKKSASIQVRRSKDEIKLFQLLCSKYEGVLHNHIIKDGWDGDIVIPSIKTVILWNGPWHYKEMNMKNHSLKQVQTRDRIKTKIFSEAGWIVKVFEDRNYTPEQAFIELVGGCEIESQSLLL